MCIACELGFWIAIDQPPPDAALSPDEQAAPFACDVPEAEPQPAAPPIADERKP
jgi:hypothetical protein